MINLLLFQVEILGVYDRKTHAYRLFAAYPDSKLTATQRMKKILRSLKNVVHPNALIVCDGSMNVQILYEMDYQKESINFLL